MDQFFQIANIEPKVRRPLAALLFVFLIASSAMWGQSANGKSLSTIRGVVRDKSGSPVPGATVQLEGNGQESRASRSDSSGTYSFLDVLPASAYRLRIEMPSSSEATFGPFVLRAGESKHVDLNLRPKSDSLTEQPAFYDEPQFTVAGVTDTTNLGGHGSNATSRARSEATKEIVALGSERNAPESPGSLATRKAREEADRNLDDFAANRRAGDLLLEDGKATEAVTYFSRAARLRPNDFDNSYGLAEAYLKSVRLQEARTATQAVLENHDTSLDHQAKAHHLLAEIEEKLGDPLEAVRHYQVAAELQPSEENLFDWGAELLLHHAPEPATNVFSKGNRLFPKSTRIIVGLGVSWYVRGFYDKAVETLSEASDLAPDDPAPHMFLGRLRSVDASQSPLYAEKLGRFAERQPDNPRANYYYALSLWKQRAGPNGSNNLSLVESLLEKATRLDPTFALAHLQLGAVYAENGDLPSAIAAYLKAAQADPTLEEPHYRLAQAYKRTGQSEKAKAESQLYNELSKKAAEQEDSQRREIQQFVFTVSGRNAAAPPQ
jgi:tetratricopeptide (TPR) repeat protein